MNSGAMAGFGYLEPEVMGEASDQRELLFTVVRRIHHPDDCEDEKSEIDEFPKHPQRPKEGAEDPKHDINGEQDEALLDVEFYEGIVFSDQIRNDDQRTDVSEYCHDLLV